MGISITQTFTTSAMFTVPSYSHWLKVECWGGGGDGGTWGEKFGGLIFTDSGGGGGGGAYARLNHYPVTPGDTYSIHVAYAPGDFDYIDDMDDSGSPLPVFAEGGFPGDSAPTDHGVSGTYSDGGIGGRSSASIGDVKFSGGKGSPGLGDVGGGGGGSSAGPAHAGTAAINATGATAPTGGGRGGNGDLEGDSPIAQDGFAPGGGGGGGTLEDDVTEPGIGGVGQVKVTYPVVDNIHGHVRIRGRNASFLLSRYDAPKAHVHITGGHAFLRREDFVFEANKASIFATSHPTVLFATGEATPSDTPAPAGNDTQGTYTVGVDGALYYIDLDLVDGTGGSHSMNEGWEVTRKAMVRNIPAKTNGTRNIGWMLDHAERALIGLVGDRGHACPDLPQPNFLVSFSHQVKSTDVVESTITYRGKPRATIDFNTGLESVETNKDINGNTIVVSYDYPESYLLDPRKQGDHIVQGGMVSVQVHSATVTMRWVQTGDILNGAYQSATWISSWLSNFVGCINADAAVIIGAIAGSQYTLMIVGYEASSRDGGVSYECAMTFQYREGGWPPLVTFINPDDGKPPPDLVEGEGYYRPEVYRTAFFYQIFNFIAIGIGQAN